MDTRIENWSNSTIGRKLYEYLKWFIWCVYISYTVYIICPHSSLCTAALACSCWDTCSCLLCQMIGHTVECVIIVTSRLSCPVHTNDEEAFRKNKHWLWWLTLTLRCSHVKKLPKHESLFSAWGPSPPFSSHVLSLFSVIDCFMSDIKSNTWSTKHIMGRFD